MGDKIGVAIMGGTGFGAGELLRLLVNHPQAEVVSITSTSAAGKHVAAAHPFLERFYNIEFEEALNVAKLSTYGRAVVFSALPHGSSGTTIEKLIAEKLPAKIIDLSGDLRIKDPALNQVHYPEAPKSAALRESFVYGLPELWREKVSAASNIANPGCLSSSCILAVAPLLDGGDPISIHFDAKTGTSGAGRTLRADLHHPVMNANCSAYKVLSHRHEPEIQEGLTHFAQKSISTTFVPHLLPVSRGILVTASVSLEKEQTTEALRAKYRNFYRSSPFIRIREESPDLSSVIGSNFCDLSVFARGKQIIAIAALDNLVKGMAGSAIQNMNLLFGLDERTALWNPSLALL